MQFAYLRSDKAGCYHGSQLVAMVPTLSKDSGIYVKRWDFSDPQSGKGPCDRIAALVKRKVRLYIDENNKCTTGKEFVACACSYGGNKGVTLVYADSETLPNPTKAKIPAISTYNNFQFTEEKITAWKAYDVGVGVEIPKKYWQHVKLQSTLTALEVFNEGQKQISPPLDDSLWLKQVMKAEKTIVDSNHDEDVSVEDETRQYETVFACPEEGCTMSYQYHSNLMNHLTSGIHNYQPERITLRDAAIQSYKHKLETTSLFPNLLDLKDAIESFFTTTANTDGLKQLERGWALRKQKQTKLFNEKQRKYLLQKFEDGKRMKRKFDPKVIADEMKRNNLFEKSEFLTWQQIASFWSREAAKRRGESLPFSVDEESIEDSVKEDDFVEDANLGDLEEEITEGLASSDIFEQ